MAFKPPAEEYNKTKPTIPKDQSQAGICRLPKPNSKKVATPLI